SLSSGRLENHGWGPDVSGPVQPFYCGCRFGGVSKRVLFDTGASGLLLLSSIDYGDLKDKVKNIKVAEAIGVNMVGISGVGQPVEIDKVAIGEMTFLDKKFTNVGSITINMGMSIIGIDMLRYGKIVIDYMRERFYFSRMAKSCWRWCA
ncbi:MAG: hypothetical protein ACLU4N_17730, partial [Butyricimonas faecihominis]